MKRKIFVAANPGTGGKKLEPVLRDLMDYLVSRNHDFEVFLTSKSRNGTRTLEENFDESHTDLIVLGGDGTLNEAINGLRFDRPVGIIPCGSANDFSKTLYLGRSMDEKIETAVSGKKIRIDLGICNDRKFINGAGVGFDGQVVAELSKSGNPLLKGPLKYYYQVLRILATYRARKVRFRLHDREDCRDLILMTIGNGTTFGGGLRLTPDARIDDGLLDVCLIEELSPLRRFLNVGRLKSGSHIRLPEVSVHLAETLYIDENPLLNAHIDGEFMGTPPFRISVLPAALTIRAKGIR